MHGARNDLSFRYDAVTREGAARSSREALAPRASSRPGPET